MSGVFPTQPPKWRPRIKPGCQIPERDLSCCAAVPGQIRYGGFVLYNFQRGKIMTEETIVYQGENATIPRITFGTFGDNGYRICEIASYDEDGEYQGSIVLDQQEVGILIKKFEEVFEL